MIAFKSTPTIFDEDDKEKDDKDFSLLVKNVRRMYNNANSIVEDVANKRRRKR